MTSKKKLLIRRIQFPLKIMEEQEQKLLDFLRLFKSAVQFAMDRYWELTPHSAYDFRALLTATAERQVHAENDIKAHFPKMMASHLEPAISKAWEACTAIATKFKERETHYKETEKRLLKTLQTCIKNQKCGKSCKYKDHRARNVTSGKIEDLGHNQFQRLIKRQLRKLRENPPEPTHPIYKNLVARLGKGTFGFVQENEHWYLSISLFPSKNGRDMLLILPSNDSNKTKLEEIVYSKQYKTKRPELEYKKERFYLNYPESKEVPDSLTIQPDIVYTAIGVDLGIINTATAVVLENDSVKQVQFFSGKKAHWKRTRWRILRGIYQQKGYISEQDKTTGICKSKPFQAREARFITDTNHRISKELVALAKQYPDPIICMETLEGIRERKEAFFTGKRKERQNDVQRIVSKVRLRMDIHRWSYYQLQQFITYKANWEGIPVLELTPKNTSRTCPICAYTDSENRNRLEFKCLKCGYIANADYVGARNIAGFGLQKIPEILKRIEENKRKAAAKKEERERKSV
jgi:IS605 OrfB family transposase